MRIRKSAINTYLGVLENVCYNQEEVDNNFIHRLSVNFKQLATSMPFTSPVFFIIDYTKVQYVTITESTRSLVQYAPEEFMEGGIGFLLHIYNPDDFKIYNEKIFSANTQFLRNTPQKSHENYVFTYNYRLKNAADKWVSVHQRSTYITSKLTGLPLYNIGIGIDISDYKSDTVMIHTIEEYENKGNHFERKLISKNWYYPNEEDTLLTRQEKNILSLMAEGRSSKNIADKLMLSENTILNHRKNMLQKTNTQNTAELIAFSIKNKII